MEDFYVEEHKTAVGRKDFSNILLVPFMPYF